MELRFGNTPVPWTVSWSSEESFTVGACREFKRRAILQTEAQGEGTPLFGKPHSQRQRAAIARGLCDLCGKPLKNRTRVSLSHARVVPHGADGPCVMQVEPLLHKECAATSLRFCPSLRRDVSNGTLFVRQVTRCRPQAAIMSAEYVESVTGQREQALGHAKVELLQWQDRDALWLDAAA